MSFKSEQGFTWTNSLKQNIDSSEEAYIKNARLMHMKITKMNIHKLAQASSKTIFENHFTRNLCFNQSLTNSVPN